MTLHVFIAPEGIRSERWALAFTGAIILDADNLPADLPEADIYWLLSDCSNWQALTAELAADNKRVVVLSSNEQQAQALLALAAGARGYAHCLCQAQTLVQISQVVMARGFWVGPDLMKQMIGDVGKLLGTSVHADALAGLTGRECDVALLVADGLSNKAIAAKMSISERTVKAHLAAIFAKRNLKDRLQLALIVKGHKPL